MAVAMIGPKFYAWDRNGKPLAGGKLYTYQAGTVIEKDTYTTENQDVTNTNPVILNSEGYADVYLNGSYKMVLTDSDDNEIWSSDPVTSSSAEEWIGCASSTYVSPTSFKLAGDLTGLYEIGRRVRVDNNAATYAYSTITSSSFSSGNTLITVSDSIIEVGIIDACVSVISANSIPDINPDNINDLKSSDFSSGVLVQTKGRKLAGDSGGSKYLIQTAAEYGGTPDGYGDIPLDNGNIAVLQVGYGYRGASFGMISGNLGDADDNKAAITAAQTYVKDKGGVLLLDPGYYLISEFNILAGVKILAQDDGVIEFRSALSPIIRLESGVTHDGTEFHGILNCTGAAAIQANGLLLMDDDNTIIESVNFDGVTFKSPNFGANGALIVAGNSLNTNHSWIKKWSMRGAVYDGCGRMGAEFLNQSTPAVITGMTIGANATFTAAGLFDEAGRTVLIEGLVGDSTVEALNERYFKLININVGSGTFQLEKADGTLVDTTGGTYTSGGTMRVCRVENIDLSGSIFKQVGVVDPALGMGFSGDTALMNVDLSNSVFLDTPNYGAELVGLWGTNLKGATWENCTGEPISTSNKFGYDNQIEGCKTIGEAAKRLFISQQKRLRWVNNDFSTLADASFTEVHDSEMYGGAIRTKGTVAAIFDQSSNNNIHDITLDNSDSTNNFSTLRFFGANSTGNIAKNITLLKGQGGGYVDEVGGASGNTVRDYRTKNSGDFDQGIIVPESSVNYGLVSTFARRPYSDVRELNSYSDGSGYTSFRVKHLITSGSGQKQAFFKFSWNGRDGNFPIGGQFGIAFGSFDDYDATPIVWQQGSTVTLGTVQFDGSGYPYWDIALPTNSGTIYALVEASVQNDAEAAEFEITLIP